MLQAWLDNLALIFPAFRSMWCGGAIIGCRAFWMISIASATCNACGRRWGDSVAGCMHMC